MKQSISILGAGWLGLPLAVKLQTDYEVKVAVQSDESFKNLPLDNKHQLSYDTKYYDKSFYDCDTLIIAIPPRGKYLATLDMVVSYISKRTQIILCSSTSVYPQTQGLVCEKDTDNVKKISLMLQAERFVQDKHQKTLVLRLAGLMGYDRIAGRYTAGKTLEHDSYVNYVHRDDAVASIILGIKHVATGCFNIVAPIHSSKKEIYDANAQKFSFENTHFLSDTKISKQVSSQLFTDTYHYSYIYDNPLLFWSE